MATDADAYHWGPHGDLPPAEAFHIEPVIDPFEDIEVVGMVRHAGHAFQAPLPRLAGAGANPARLADTVFQAISCRYLTALADRLAAHQPPQVLMHPDLLKSLAVKSSARQRFGWLPITQAGLPQGEDPASSFWLTRMAHDGSVADRSLVMLAGRRWQGQSQGGDIGLRLALHIGYTVGSGWQARIHGVALSCLRPAQALAPMPAWLQQAAKQASKQATRLSSGAGPNQPVPSFRQEIEDRIAETLGLAQGHWIQTYRPIPGDADARDLGDLRVTGLGPLKRHASITGKDSAPLFRFEVQVDASRQVTRVLRFEAHNSYGKPLQGQVDMLERDPASGGSPNTLRDRRPTRAELAPFRNIVWPLPDLVTRLDAGGADPRYQVWGLPPGQEATLATDNAQVVQVSAQDTVELRSDAMGAVHALLRAFDLFAHLDAYGLMAEDYFRHARLPLVLRPRAAMRGAPAGDAINAEVRPFWPDTGPPLDTSARTVLADDAALGFRPQLMVRFAAANTSHRVMLPLPAATHGAAAASANDSPQSPGVGRQRAQYLGVAADPRWAWHEFGHVLNFAATGELELPFAHGVGDALAAISADPDSELAIDPQLRFVTYPWVQVAGRRHDRSVADGYGWCGRRNRVRLAHRAARAHHHHGYFEGQILSSTLFRLYRSIGGDTSGDTGTDLRREAADYCVYLIVRALALLGADSIAPARTADQFASALIDADLGTDVWQVRARWPYRDGYGRDLLRQGGQVHKVIRWAFEQQGLYATDRPRETSDQIGQAPAVDVYLADRRGAPKGRHEFQPGDGGYGPVELLAIDDPANRWLAHPQWLRLVSGGCQVWLANRGSVAATGVRLQCWQRPVGAGAAWARLGAVTSLAAPLGPACGPMAITVPVPGAWPPAAAVDLLVNLHCDADPSNWPLDQAPPDSPTALMQWVANDNNLALARWSPQGSSAS